MTGPATTEALRTALARSAIEAKFGPEGVSVIFDTPDEATDHQRAVLAARAEEARRVADFAIAGPLAPLLAALQQGTAERDAEKARADRIDAKLGELNAAVREHLPPIDTLIAEREAVEAALATATSELARLRAEAAERQATDDALSLNDGELEADPQKMIAHLQHACREFIRERNEWKASAKAEWTTADRLRAEGEAKDGALKDLRADAAELGARLGNASQYDDRRVLRDLCWEAGNFLARRIVQPALARAATARKGA